MNFKDIIPENDIFTYTFVNPLHALASYDIRQKVVNVIKLSLDETLKNKIKGETSTPQIT